MPEFEEWCRFVFDHPVRDPGVKEWYWDEDFDEIYEPWNDASRAIASSTRLFRDPAVLDTYSPAQVGEGLWFLLGPRAGNISEVLWTDEVDLAARLECVRSMESFFAKYVVAHCTGKFDPRAGEEPETAVYMWWDLVAAHYWELRLKVPGRKEVETAVLDTLEAIIALPNDLCARSAVHGLGHMHARYPARVEKIIDSFLGAAPNASTELIEYAKKARSAEKGFQ
jgi:hypothetical protein